MMTEEEWLTSPNPRLLLDAVRDRAGARKLRLFACACVRRVWDLLTAEEGRQAVQVAERFADDEVSQTELYQAPGRVRRTRRFLPPSAVGTPHSYALFAAGCAVHANVVLAFGETPLLAVRAAGLGERAAQADLVRCLFGNPFRPAPTFDPAWRTPTVLAIARQAYEEHDFGVLPVLADALEEAGCDDAEILAHGRNPGPHARGCFVVDGILGRA
jgi:hypothetical protein